MYVKIHTESSSLKYRKNNAWYVFRHQNQRFERISVRHLKRFGNATADCHVLYTSVCHAVHCCTSAFCGYALIGTSALQRESNGKIFDEKWKFLLILFAIKL
jgi:hypothetical protein